MPRKGSGMPHVVLEVCAPFEGADAMGRLAREDEERRRYTLQLLWRCEAHYPPRDGDATSDTVDALLRGVAVITPMSDDDDAARA
mmetsp:Transcript_30334/g.96807  ORF Transcript_30334/g.96807 Transcript_30334/m.96807 type:complete len:85 (-) Transcript_30334:431-685(-)